MVKKGFRNTKQKLRTARGRTTSSQKWLSRHINDPYVNLAKSEGYRSRAAYKLKEIDDKFKLLKNVRTIVDLGCAPGGWLQIAKERARKDAQIVGIDLLEVSPLDDVKLIQGDFTQDEVLLELEKLIPQKVDLIMSDMAANSSGNKEVDYLKNITLVEIAFEFVQKHLKTDGIFIAKVFRCSWEQKLYASLKPHFSNCKQFKPSASYSSSSEVYFVCMGYKGDAV